MRINAFTLAEVLITLGIIGVVAAMTMPTLVANVQDKVLETQRSKAKNVLANGYKKMLADNKVFELSDTPLSDCATTNCIDAEHQTVFKTVKSGVGLTNLNLPSSYIDKDGNEYAMDWSNKYVFITPDGYTYGLDVDKFLSEKTYNIYTDINGAKNPSKEKKDMVLFTVSANGTVAEADLVSSACSRNNLDACSEEECWALPSYDITPAMREVYEWVDGRCQAFGDG